MKRMRDDGCTTAIQCHGLMRPWSILAVMAVFVLSTGLHAVETTWVPGVPGDPFIDGAPRPVPASTVDANGTVFLDGGWNCQWALNRPDLNDYIYDASVAQMYPLLAPESGIAPLAPDFAEFAYAAYNSTPATINASALIFWEPASAWEYLDWWDTSGQWLQGASSIPNLIHEWPGADNTTIVQSPFPANTEADFVVHERSYLYPPGEMTPGARKYLQVSLIWPDAVIDPSLPSSGQPWYNAISASPELWVQAVPYDTAHAADFPTMQGAFGSIILKENGLTYPYGVFIMQGRQIAPPMPWADAQTASFSINRLDDYVQRAHQTIGPGSYLINLPLDGTDIAQGNPEAMLIRMRGSVGVSLPMRDACIFSTNEPETESLESLIVAQRYGTTEPVYHASPDALRVPVGTALEIWGTYRRSFGSTELYCGGQRIDAVRYDLTDPASQEEPVSAGMDGMGDFGFRIEPSALPRHVGYQFTGVGTTLYTLAVEWFDPASGPAEDLPADAGCVQCPLPTGQITPLTSRVENPQLSHIHTATDYQSAGGASGCGPCGASAGGGGGLTTDIRLDRIHRYADFTRAGSFGPGVFSNLDIGLTLWNHGESGEIWDPSAASPIPLTRTVIGHYSDLKRSAIASLVLYAADGTTVVDADAAVTATATQHDGSAWVFELVQAGLSGDADRQGRLIAIRDRVGNQLIIVYAFPATASDAVLGSRSRLLEMATATDQRGRQLSFAYGWSCGQPVVTTVTYPTGSVVQYHYDGDIAGIARIDYPDGTQSTFNLREDAPSQCMVVDYQDAGAEGTHRTKSVFLTKTSFTQADGTVTAQSPNRVRRVVDPTGVPTYLNWLERDGAQVKIYVYEGGGIAGTGRMLRLDTTEGVTDTTWIAQQWSFATEPATWTWEKVADYEADTRFRMCAQTDPLGKSTTYQRDPTSGAITGREHRNASGSIVSRESTEYNGMRLPTRHQDANGLITRSIYDDQGNLRFRTEGIVLAEDGVTEDATHAVTSEWRYRADGQVLMEIDPLGRAIEYEYDTRGFRTAEVSPPDDQRIPLVRARREWHYDVAGRLEWSKDAAGHTTRYFYDDRNRVQEVRYGNESKELYQYGIGADANLLLSKTDRDGMVTAFGYDAAGREIMRVEGAQVPALAITTTTTYLEGTDLPQTVTRAGQKTEYVYDTRKRVIETRRWIDGTRYLADRTVFDAGDRVAYTQDTFDRRTYSVYDDLDRVTRTIREAVPGGVPAAVDLALLSRILSANPPYVIEETSYDVGGRVLTTTDAAGVMTRLGYDHLGRMTDRWEAFGTPVEAHWQWTYDAVGNRETETDPLLHVTRFAYTGRNLLAAQTIAFGTADAAATRFTYTLTGQRSTQTDANDHTTQWIYGNCCDWLEDVIDAAGYFTHYTYTPGGLIETVRDASLHLTRTDYDGLKRPFAVTNGDTETATTLYDDNLLDAIGLSGTFAAEFARIADRTGHHAVAVRNHMQETSVQVSDGLGRTVLVVDAERHVTQTIYDLMVIASDGSTLVETATTDPLNNTVRRRVDGLGRVREVTDALQHVTAIYSDANGNRLGVADPLGHGTSFTFDARNRQTGSTDAADNSTSVEYDLLGNVLRQSDGFTHATEFTYTARNQKASETDRLGHTSTFSYDPAGNLLTISDAENEAKKATVTPEVYEAGKTRYTYTERNQLETERFPGETAARSYTYHPNGQLKTRTDQRGIVTTYSYDGANRLTDRSYSDGTADHFVLDDAGRITSATASRYGVVVGRTYYPTGLIKSETTTWPFGISGTSTSATVNYEYDAANHGVTLGLPDGRSLTRTFTARNELESLTIGGQAIATLGYDNAGRRTSALYGNGLIDERGFTDNNLLKTTVLGPEAAPLLSLEYAYDANNRKTSETDHRDPTRSVSMGYDDNDRLTSWTTGGNPRLPTSQTWELSAVGNWKKTTVDGVVENREHTDVHEVKTRNGVAVGYDPAGNLIRTAAGQGFAWDAENRLLAADTVPNADGAKDKAVYQTDAFGRRVAKSVYGSTYLVIHDGWQVVQELSGPTTLPASAAADDGSLANLATMPAGAIMPTTYDAQGNPLYPKRINFQPATTPIPSGYLADKSKDFAVRSNGLSYGWVAAGGAPSRSEPVIRHFMPLPQYDTFVPTGDPETWTWQIALPAGSYPVVLVLGDATNREHTFNVTVQGETFPDPHPYDPAENTGYEAGRFVGVAKQVTVGEDGLLTIQAAAGALNGTLCWLEVGAEGTQVTEELRQKLADEVTHANARTGGSPFWDGGRSETKTFVWGPGIDELMGYQRTTAETGTTTYFVHGNQQWSVYAVTDASGQIVERFQYTATGKRASDVAGANGRSLVGLSTGFTGRDHDDATGTVYFRNRIWEPDYQFLNRDPARYVDGMSLYRGYFVPVAMDPSGRRVLVQIPLLKSGERKGTYNTIEYERANFDLEIVQALQAFIGDNAHLTLKTTTQIFRKRVADSVFSNYDLVDVELKTWSEIGFDNEKAGNEDCDPCWKLLKAALMSGQTLAVRYDTQRFPLTLVDRFAPYNADVYVDPDNRIVDHYQGDYGATLADGTKEAKSDFGVILWHELIGHGSEKTGGDDTIAIENIGRKCRGLPLRMPNDPSHDKAPHPIDPPIVKGR